MSHGNKHVRHSPQPAANTLPQLEHRLDRLPEARLEHREHLERTAPEAFVSGDKLERVLAELRGGEEHGFEDEYGRPIKGGVAIVTKRRNRWMTRFAGVPAS